MTKFYCSGAYFVHLPCFEVFPSRSLNTPAINYCPCFCGPSRLPKVRTRACEISLHEESAEFRELVSGAMSLACSSHHILSGLFSPSWFLVLLCPSRTFVIPLLRVHNQLCCLSWRFIFFFYSKTLPRFLQNR